MKTTIFSDSKGNYVYGDSALIQAWVQKWNPETKEMRIRAIDEGDVYGMPREFDEHMDLLDRRERNTRTLTVYVIPNDQAYREARAIAGIEAADHGQAWDKSAKVLQEFKDVLPPRPADAPVKLHNCGGEIHYAMSGSQLIAVCKKCGQTFLLGDYGLSTWDNMEVSKILGPVLNLE